MQKIVKSNGSVVDFDPEKLNKWAEYAAAQGGEWSAIALEAYRKCHDGCTTQDLHKAMIDACVEREDHTHLQIAGRLLVGSIYKEAYGGYSKIPTLMDYVGKMFKGGYWDWMSFSRFEIEELNTAIDHSHDNGYTYTSLRQMKDKYLIQNRKTKQCLESPQFMFMGMAMRTMENERNNKVAKTIALYNHLSNLKINAPTPFLVNMRTPHKGYASCCVSIADDTIPSLAANDHIAYVMTAKSAGIGNNINSRSKGDPIRGGTVVHQGLIPYLKVIAANVHANMQSSRGGACTSYVSCLNPEIEDVLVLKNPTTIQQKRVREIDYGFMVNKLFMEKAAKNLEWMLVSILNAPKLHELFYSDKHAEFEMEYERVLNDTSIPKTLVSARKIAVSALKEGAETGRIYIAYMDTMNHQTPFLDAIYSSNLCAEIALPTKPFKDVTDLYSDKPEGEIGLCSLASIVLCNIKDDKEYEDVAYYTTLMIDNSIDNMEYPFKSLEVTAKARRSIGVGITDLAHYLASLGLSYKSSDGRSVMNYVAERHLYYLVKASVKLAEERGPAKMMNVSKYKNGWMPFDDASPNVLDVLEDPRLSFAWDALRQRVKAAGGLRNSTLVAFMPNESSSQLTNTTNSLYPIRNYRVMKTSGSNKNLLIAPNLDKYYLDYELAWDIPSKDLINMYAIFQRFTDQAISADLYLDLRSTTTDMNVGISTTNLLQDFFYMYKMGCKTRYYINSAAGIIHESFTTEEVADDGCSACKL